MGEHGANRGNCRLLRAAVLKYGIESFDKEILARDLSVEDANILEDDFIQKLGTITPGGYNLKSGGRNSTHSDDTKKRMSEVKIGHKNLTQASIEKMLATRKINSMGRPPFRHSDESKKKMSEQRKGVKKSKEHNQKVSEALTGRVLSESHLRNMSLANLGKIQSAETIAKMVATQKKNRELRGKRKQTPEHTAAVVASRKINKEARLAVAGMGSPQ